MKKLWNYAPYPVWSLVSHNQEGVANMNICTYVTPHSMKPKEFMVALYKNTQTLENMQKTHHGILQLLSSNQTHLVGQLGKKSSRTTNKMKYIFLKESLAYHNTLPYLTNAVGFVELEFFQYIETQGDHIIGLAKAVYSKNLNETEVMTTQILQEKKIIL
jgi:flavin reductase (DIM6/NTAB) family NADH-FMN oxidoreductase RutF